MGTIAKQSFRGTIVTYIGVAIGFVTTFFVLTRFLAAEDIGLARILIDTATLFVGLAQLGTNSSIIRFYPYFKSGNTDHGFFFYTLVIPFLGFLLFACIYWACSVPLAAYFGEKSPLFVDYYYFVLPLAFFMLYQTIFETNANVLMHIVVPRAVREVAVRIGLLVSYLLYAFRVISMDGFVIALCLTYGIAALINIAYLFSLGHISLRPDWTFIKQNPSLVRKYALYTGFLIVSALTSVLAPIMSSFIITGKQGLASTGIFAIATYMAAMVSIPSRSLIAITQPELSQAIKDNDRTNTSRLIAQASNNLLLAGGFILLFIWLNIDLIFDILPNGDTYATARYAVLLLGFGQLLVGTFGIFLPALNYSRFYAFSLLNSLVLTASALILNNALIPIFGITGAALATLLSDIVYYILVVAVTCSVLHIMPFKRQHLVCLLLFATMFALNYAWLKLAPAFTAGWLGLIRFFVIAAAGIDFAWRRKLSPELHEILCRIRI